MQQRHSIFRKSKSMCTTHSYRMNVCKYILAFVYLHQHDHTYMQNTEIFVSLHGGPISERNEKHTSSYPARNSRLHVTY